MSARFVGRGMAARVAAVAIGLTMAGLFMAPAAQAAAPSRSLTPVLNCYWDNSDGTITAALGVRSTNAGQVTVAIGNDNRFAPGAADRGQPTTFQPGQQNNLFVITVSYAEVAAGLNWTLTGNTVDIDNAAACSKKPVPADGNSLAVMAFGAVAALVGAVAFGDRARRRHA